MADSESAWQKFVRETKAKIKEKCGTCTSGRNTSAGVMCVENPVISYDCKHCKFQYHEAKTHE